ncbi:MAG: hypothetical protein ACOCZ5_02600 [bacterium]
MDKNRNKLGEFAKGNTIRLKWTKPKTKRKLNELLKILAEDDNRFVFDEEGVKHKLPTKIFSIPQLMSTLSLPETWFRDIEKKYKDDEDINDLINIIRTHMEARVITRTADNTINPYLGIFMLKGYHGKVEKQYIQTENENNNKNEHTGEVKINLIYPNKEDEDDK